MWDKLLVWNLISKISQNHKTKSELASVSYSDSKYFLSILEPNLWEAWDDYYFGSL